MIRSSLAMTTAAALLVSISSAALAQGMGGSAPGGNAGGALIMPRSTPNNMPSQSSEGTGSAPTNLGNGAAPSALTLPNIDKMTPAQIQARLQSSGFQNIRNFTKQHDGGYTATAMKDGQPVKLLIGASSGRVTTTND